jgi:hypothetical protein
LSGENGQEKAANPREEAKIGLDLAPPALIASAMHATVAQVRH